MLKTAIKDVKENKTAINRAAKTVGIPRSTLNNHFNGKAKGFVRGRPPVFTHDEEQGLVDLIFKLSESGFGLDKDTLISVVAEFAKCVGKSNKFVNGIPGIDWVNFCTNFTSTNR